MGNIAKEISKLLFSVANQEKKETLQRFFKTGKGEYGEDDQFIGVKVPEQRKIAKLFWNKISLDELGILMTSKIHEERLTALLILIIQFEKLKHSEAQKNIIDFYLNHLDYINNWDLVDTSCYKILGRYCFENNCSHLLLGLSKSEPMWHKRIAVVGTLYFIKRKEFSLTKTIVLQEIHHPHDLMHKANGWMLREIGNIDEHELISFLKKHYRTMPRTTLRYAIEKLEEPIRQQFLKGEIA